MEIDRSLVPHVLSLPTCTARCNSTISKFHIVQPRESIYVWTNNTTDYSRQIWRLCIWRIALKIVWNERKLLWCIVNRRNLCQHAFVAFHTRTVRIHAVGGRPWSFSFVVQRPVKVKISALSGSIDFRYLFYFRFWIRREFSGEMWVQSHERRNVWLDYIVYGGG